MAEEVKGCGVRINDLDCYSKDCPQKRDDEPKKTGRSCPRANWGDDDW